MVTRTRKASSQNTDASAQPRAKKQKTAAPAQSITVKTEPVEPQQQRPQQRQRQSSPPPKRKAARRGSAAKKEDVAQRTKNLERNRIAASKCRQKKKEWVVELEESKTKMELHHNKLRIEYLELLGEVTSIKNQLMAHANCVDPNINFWIEKEALKYVERCAMDPAQERRPSVVGNGELDLRYGGRYSIYP
jgi:chromosome segregation ATPase